MDNSANKNIELMHQLVEQVNASEDINTIRKILDGEVPMDLKIAAIEASIFVLSMHKSAILMDTLIQGAKEQDLFTPLVRNATNFALVCAASHGHLEVVKVLLGHGINVNYCVIPEQRIIVEMESKILGFTPLLTAAAGNHLTVLHELITRGANLEEEVVMTSDAHLSIAGLNALALTAHYGNIESAKILIKAGADVNACTGITDYGTPLMHAIISEKNDMVKFLLSLKAVNLNLITLNGRSALTAMIQEDNVEALKEFLKSSRIDFSANVVHSARMIFVQDPDDRTNVEDLLQDIVPCINAENEKNFLEHFSSASVEAQNILLARKVSILREALDNGTNKPAHLLHEVNMNIRLLDYCNRNEPLLKEPLLIKDLQQLISQFHDDGIIKLQYMAIAAYNHYNPNSVINQYDTTLAQIRQEVKENHSWLITSNKLQTSDRYLSVPSSKFNRTIAESHIRGNEVYENSITKSTVNDKYVQDLAYDTYNSVEQLLAIKESCIEEDLELLGNSACS